MPQTQDAPFTRSSTPNWARGRTGGNATTTQAFTLPGVGDSVGVYVDDTSWLSIGHYVFVTNGAALAYLKVTAISSGVVTAEVADYSGGSTTGTVFSAGSDFKLASRPPSATSAMLLDPAIARLPSVTTAQGALEELALRTINVKAFGAIGNGASGTADTAGIIAAFNYSKAFVWATLSGDLGKMGTARLYLPAGDYVFNGPALDAVAGLAIEIIGDGYSHTRLQIASGNYFINTTNVVYSMKISGIHTYGGKGVWKHSYASANVQGQYIVDDCMFVAYTECAVVSLSSDMPYFKFRRNILHGTTSSKGLALAGATDQCDISENAFLLNRYHLKLGQGGNNAKIKRNDFIRYASGGGAPQLCDIWIVPHSIATNAGNTCDISSNKFGNENISQTDFRVLVADQGSGTDFADKAHSTAVSSGYWVGAQILHNYVACGGTFSNGFVHSFTPRVYGFLIESEFVGGFPSKIVKFDAAVTFANDNRVEDLGIIRATGFIDGTEQYIPPLCTRPGIALIDDPLGLQLGNPESLTKYGAGFDPGMVNFGATPLDTSALLLVSATKTAATDALGGANAAEVTFTLSSGFAYLDAPTTNVTIGRRAWLEVDIKKSAARAVDYVTVSLSDNGANIAVKRFVTVPANWTTIRIPFIQRQTGSALAFRFDCADFSGTVRDRLVIGRMRLYHANEPMNEGAAFLESKTTFDPSNLADGAGETTTIAVAGAALGDFAEASFSLSLQGITLTAWVSAANTVSVRFQNETGGALDLASGTLRARTRKPTV